jgi:hypothetical protein
LGVKNLELSAYSKNTNLQKSLGRKTIIRKITSPLVLGYFGHNFFFYHFATKVNLHFYFQHKVRIFYYHINPLRFLKNRTLFSDFSLFGLQKLFSECEVLNKYKNHHVTY